MKRNVRIVGLCLMVGGCIPAVSVKTTDDGYVLCAEVIPQSKLQPPVEPKPNGPSAPAPSTTVERSSDNTPPWAPMLKYKPVHLQ